MKRLLNWLAALSLTTCTGSHARVDLEKRQLLVNKYDLLNFTGQPPVYVTVDEFFDGNQYPASIAPNLTRKPKVSEYYKTLRALRDNLNVTDVLVNLGEVMVYDGKLDDNEWFYADAVYVIGDIGKEEVETVTKNYCPIGWTMKKIPRLYASDTRERILFMLRGTNFISSINKKLKRLLGGVKA